MRSPLKYAQALPLGLDHSVDHSVDHSGLSSSTLADFRETRLAAFHSTGFYHHVSSGAFREKSAERKVPSSE